MTAMAIFLSLLAAVNLAVAYLWLCQRALEKSLSPGRAIWPAILPAKRTQAAAPAKPVFAGGMLDPVPAAKPAANSAPAKPAAPKSAKAKPAASKAPAAKAAPAKTASAKTAGAKTAAAKPAAAKAETASKPAATAKAATKKPARAKTKPKA